MPYAIGKFLEAVGLCAVTLGFIVGFGYNNVRAELIYLAVGSGVFALGWLLERRYRK